MVRPDAVQGCPPEGTRSQSAEPAPREGRLGCPEGDCDGRTNARLELRSGELPGDTLTERHPPGGTRTSTENCHASGRNEGLRDL